MCRRLAVGREHLAAIAGTPTLALFGPTDPAIWQPLGPNTRILKADSIETITVNQILDSMMASSRSAD